MAYRDFQHFLEVLESKGELRRIVEPVDPYLEITEIADRVMKAGGPALLFEAPRGHDVPLLINAFGSYRRMSRALGVDDLEVHAQRLQELLRPELPRGWSGMLNLGGT